MTTTEAVKRGLLLLGSFAIAFNAAEFLHELGHAAAAWITGGWVGGIVVHPFNWSYCMAGSPHPLFLTVGGTLFSSVAAVLFFVLLIRRTRPYLLPLLLIGPITLINNGDYLLVDSLVNSGGDASSLIIMGISPAVIIPVAVLLLVSGFALAVRLIRKVRLLDGSFRIRMLILGLGILPYLLTALMWNVIYDRWAAMDWLAYTLSAIVLTVLFAAITRRSGPLPPPPVAINWRPIAGINASALLLMVLLLFGPLRADLTGLNNIETFSERPGDFPDILVPLPYADEAFYSRLTDPTKTVCSLTYGIPKTIPADQIIADLNNLHHEHGYILLTHWSDNPEKIHDRQWCQEDSAKGYAEEWVWVDSDVFVSLPAIVMMDQNGTPFSTHVVHSVTVGWNSKQAEAYLSMHPEQFNAEQTERLRQLIAQRREDYENGLPETATHENEK